MFLSKGYFFSGNCLRELDQSLKVNKPILLVHESDVSRGGAPLDVLKADAAFAHHRKVAFDAGELLSNNPHVGYNGPTPPFGSICHRTVT